MHSDSVWNVNYRLPPYAYTFRCLLLHGPSMLKHILIHFTSALSHNSVHIWRIQMLYGLMHHKEGHQRDIHWNHINQQPYPCRCRLSAQHRQDNLYLWTTTVVSTRVFYIDMIVMEIIHVQFRQLKRCESYIDRSIQSKNLHFTLYDGQIVYNRVASAETWFGNPFTQETSVCDQFNAYTVPQILLSLPKTIIHQFKEIFQKTAPSEWALTGVEIYISLEPWWLFKC